MVREIAGVDELDTDIPLLASLSFGKDSLAMVLALQYHGIEIAECIYSDTGWEHELHYPYVDTIREKLKTDFGLNVAVVKRHVDLTDEELLMAEEIEAIAGIDNSPFIRLMIKKMSFSTRVGKWCTPILKQEPMTAYAIARYHEYTRANGIRRAESEARKHYAAHDEFVLNNRVEYSYNPIIEWSLSDVMDAIRYYGYPLHPLYSMGASRVGCFPCILCGNKEKLMLSEDKRRVDTIRALERMISNKRQEERTFFSRLWSDGAPKNIDRTMAHVRQKFADLPPEVVIDSVCHRFGWCE